MTMMNPNILRAITPNPHIVQPYEVRLINSLHYITYGRETEQVEREQCTRCLRAARR
jgi:hypothetical protein